MWAKAFYPAVAFFQRDFLRMLRARRTLVVFIFLGVLLLLVATGLGLAAADPNDEGAATPLWQRGVDGALVVFAYGVIPIVVPPFVILLAALDLARERGEGVLAEAIAKPVPVWGVALGKFGGAFAALAVFLVSIALASAYALQIVAGAAPNAALVASLVGGCLLLAALYLLLTSALHAGVPFGLGAWLALLAWLGFNILRPTASLLTLQLIGLVLPEEVITFAASEADVLSYTGLYQAALAGSVPSELGFIAAETLPLAGLLPWTALLWVGGLLALFAIALEHPLA